MAQKRLPHQTQSITLSIYVLASMKQFLLISQILKQVVKNRIMSLFTKQHLIEALDYIKAQKPQQLRLLKICLAAVSDYSSCPKLLSPKPSSNQRK